jgi:hypothetical protein
VSSAELVNDFWELSMLMKTSAVAAAAFLSLASLAQAASIKVEIWDVLAGPSTC